MVGEKQDNGWPLPKFYFTVDITGVGDKRPFQEVSALDTETQPTEYRAGDKKVKITIKMPGLLKSGNVSSRRGSSPRTINSGTGIRSST